MLKLKEKKINYTEYFIDLSNNKYNLYISAQKDGPFLSISNHYSPPFVVCHVDNLDNLIAGLKLLREKIEKSK